MRSTERDEKEEAYELAYENGDDVEKLSYILCLVVFESVGYDSNKLRTLTMKKLDTWEPFKVS